MPVITYDADFQAVQIVGTVARTSTDRVADRSDGAAADYAGEATDPPTTSTDNNATDHQVYAVSLVWTQVVTFDGTAVGAWVYDVVSA